MDTGAVVNVASASGEDPDHNTVTNQTGTGDSTTTALTPAPSLSLLKQASAVNDLDGNGHDAGDTIDYTFTVTNTGTVKISNLAITDQLLADAGIAITCQPTTLAPGALANCTPASPYVITLDDMNAGKVDNSATATGTNPAGTTTTSPDSTTSTKPTQNPSLAMVKHASAVSDANNNGRDDAGDTIDYTFTVTNTGTVTIDNLAISDPTAGAVTCQATKLVPNDSTSCAATNPYVITQPDMDAGAVVNVATANGTDPNGARVTSPGDPGESTTTPMDRASGLDLKKKVTGVTDTNGNGLTDAGDTIGYEFVLTNTGTVTLDGFTVTDPMLDQTGIHVICPKQSLAPAQSLTCTANTGYTVTAADERTGEIRNVATAAANGPGDAVVAAPSSTVVVSTEQAPLPPLPPAAPHHPAAQLPQTGGPARWIGLLGTGLLVGGFLLILRTRRSRVAE
ncbi:DUF7507 domain-containing protein, partial [Marmoricola sp. RAF53]|uniref:DUF7507 domain-containing protein n=1 Tax=Marmoricola sp. RAF53 TaxID=3233059 RepID=UPI003F9C6700